MRLATRGSPLARWQATWVADLLGGAELVVVDTAGDRDTTSSLIQIGGQGVFVKEVQAAVIDGRADAAVHSAKDLPSLTPAELVIGATLERGDPRDALIGNRLTDLPRGGVVASGSVRRRAQLAHLRPDLRFADLRGNIATRLEKAAGFDAIVMAVAALERLGMAERITEALDPAVLVPQVGQGTIAVECRADDAPTRAALAAVDHPASRWALEAERGFLAAVGGGCTLPVAAYAVAGRIDALIATPDGTQTVRAQADGDDAEELGATIAARLLQAGGAALLEGA